MKMHYATEKRSTLFVSFVVVVGTRAAAESGMRCDTVTEIATVRHTVDGGSGDFADAAPDAPATLRPPAN